MKLSSALRANALFTASRALMCLVAVALVYYLLHWRQVDSIGAALILVPSVFVALFALLQQSGLADSTKEVRI